MRQIFDNIVMSAYNAYARKDHATQAEQALQALALDPQSPLACILYFLSSWERGAFDGASDFIRGHASKYGAPGHVLLCLVVALMHQDEMHEKTFQYASRWFNSLPPDDLRKSAYDASKSELRILRSMPLASRSVTVGPIISELFGPIGPVKSMNHYEMCRRWAQPSYHIVRDISVLPDAWYLYDDQHIFLEETHARPQKLNELRLFVPPTSATVLARTEKTTLVNVPNHQKIIEERCLLLGSNSNYFYWLVTHLARLKSIEGAFDMRDIPILVDENLPPTYFDALQQLGVEDKNIIKCAPETSVYCKELIVPTLLNSVDVLHPAGIKWLRDTFGPTERDTSYPSRAFVSRSKTHRRPFVNEGEVYARLEELGFVKVTPDTMSFAEQNAVFQNADIVIGPFGTCLTTTMFAPESCTIFKIIDATSIPVHRFIENLALQIGQNFHCVIIENLNAEATEMSSALYKFEIDPDRLIQQLLPHL